MNGIFSAKRGYMLEHPGMEHYVLIENGKSVCENVTSADNQQETLSKRDPQRLHAMLPQSSLK